ncbi:DUF1481 domain-containing protein [Vibrio sp. S4M6]|uniref:DUF1481 domain-containing protein n=1 Tax=Vibrio sinus TaxID=2946865 RepID=UPI00202A8AF4|nr:DUF1481 domain-containing protein [Vibrio sinus]MCL9783498.1 DUF1481 domain-containing protein [Vibrio sinus]
MKKHILLFLITSLLVGCSSSSLTDLEKTSQYTGGEIMGDATSFYWVTENIQYPVSSADYVNDGQSGWYKTDYKWANGSVRELIRKGETLENGKGLVPFSIVIRFDQNGEAIYQQYRLDGQILPLTEAQLVRYLEEAQHVATVVNRQKSQGTELIQGIWNGKSFKSCSGKVYDKLEFNQTLPKIVATRLSSVESYIALLGNKSRHSVEVNKLLLMADENQSCIQRPDFSNE